MTTQTRIKPEDLTLLTELLAQSTRPSASQESLSPSGTVVGNGWIKTAQGLIPPARNLKEGSRFFRSRFERANIRSEKPVQCKLSRCDTYKGVIFQAELLRYALTSEPRQAAAEQAHAADAATRPQDRGDFESLIQPDSRTDLSGWRG